MTSTRHDRTDIMLGEATYRTEEPAPRVGSHASFRQIRDELEEKRDRLETPLRIARERVERLQLQLQEATREMVEVERRDEVLARELDAVWEAEVDFESLELDRQHAEAGESLKAANDRLAELAREREELEDDD